MIYGIPVFSVLSKMDKCDLAYIEIGKKKKKKKVEIDVENILICINYQPNQNPDSRDVEIGVLDKGTQNIFESIFYKFDQIIIKMM